MFKMIYNIARTELQMLFYSPVAWLILVVFGVQSGMLFADQLAQLVSSQEIGYNDLQLLFLPAIGEGFSPRCKITCISIFLC